MGMAGEEAGPWGQGRNGPLRQPMLWCAASDLEAGGKVNNDNKGLYSWIPLTFSFRETERGAGWGRDLRVVLPGRGPNC